MISKMIDTVVYTSANRLQGWMGVVISAITGLILIDELASGAARSPQFAQLGALVVLSAVGSALSFARAARETRA